MHYEEGEIDAYGLAIVEAEKIRDRLKMHLDDAFDDLFRKLNEEKKNAEARRDALLEEQAVSHKLGLQRAV